MAPSTAGLKAPPACATRAPVGEGEGAVADIGASCVPSTARRWLAGRRRGRPVHQRHQHGVVQGRGGGADARHKRASALIVAPLRRWRARARATDRRSRPERRVARKSPRPGANRRGAARTRSRRPCTAVRRGDPPARAGAGRSRRSRSRPRRAAPFCQLSRCAMAGRPSARRRSPACAAARRTAHRRTRLDQPMTIGAVHPLRSACAMSWCEGARRPARRRQWQADGRTSSAATRQCQPSAATSATNPAYRRAAPAVRSRPADEGSEKNSSSEAAHQTTAAGSIGAAQASSAAGRYRLQAASAAAPRRGRTTAGCTLLKPPLLSRRKCWATMK